MYCMKCGSQLPVGSAFCNKCGAPQGSGAVGAKAAQSETCEIKYTVVKTGWSYVEFAFVAEATGPNGLYTAGKSITWRGHQEGSDFKQHKDVLTAFNGLVRELSDS